MNKKRTMQAVGTCLVLILLASSIWAAGKSVYSDPPPERNKDEKVIAKGMLLGTIKEKSIVKTKAWIEVVSVKSQETFRFIPKWKGGMPNKGGGHDKKIIKAFAKLNEGDKVIISWYVDDHIRIKSIKKQK